MLVCERNERSDGQCIYGDEGEKEEDVHLTASGLGSRIPSSCI